MSPHYIKYLWDSARFSQNLSKYQLDESVAIFPGGMPEDVWLIFFNFWEYFFQQKQQNSDYLYYNRLVKVEYSLVEKFICLFFENAIPRFGEQLSSFFKIQRWYQRIFMMKI